MYVDTKLLKKISISPIFKWKNRKEKLGNVKYFDITFTNQMKELCDINFNSLNKDIEEDIRE